MRDILNILEASLPAPIKKVVDPAHLTLAEYRKFLNPDGKSHPRSAYDMDLSDFNQSYSLKSFKEMELLRRVMSRGREFTFKLETDRRNLCKTDENGEYLRDENNKLIPLTDEEMDALGYQKYDYGIHVFNDKGERVGYAVDEWGCVLITVAKEYRGYRLGSILGEMYMSIYPNKPSGGETANGYKAVATIHKRFVTNAMRDGSYTRWVKEGSMTVERAKEIINSVANAKRNDPEAGDREAYRPQKLSMMVLDASTTIYDTRLLNFPEDLDFHHALDNLVVAGASVGGMNRAWLTFWGNDPKHRALVAGVEVSKGLAEDYPVYLDHTMSEADLPPNLSMDENRILSIKEPIHYEHFAKTDAMVRRKLDPYEETTWEIVSYSENRS